MLYYTTLCCCTMLNQSRSFGPLERAAEPRGQQRLPDQQTNFVVELFCIAYFCH